MNQIQEVILQNKITELTKTKKYTEAERACQQLAALAPRNPQVWFALGQLQHRLGKFQLAAKSYLKSGNIKSPLAVDALTQALDLSQKHNFVVEGFMSSQELLKYQPDSAAVNYLHGFFASRTGLDHLASVFYEKAIRIKPQEKSFRLYYASVLSHMGLIETALEQFELAKKLGEDTDESHFRCLFAQNYSHTLSEQEIFKAHQEYGNRLESRYPDIEPFEPRQPGKRIRIGYVSKDFFIHSVAYFFFAIIKNHDDTRFEVFCYSDTDRADEFTEIIQANAEHWRDCQRMTDAELYQQIRDDKIDILVDLIGLTGVPRMAAYARKAAPVQVNYLGYANTSGLNRMDYRLSDQLADPVGLTERYHSEKIIRLPSGFLCYTPSEYAPDVGELPALKNGKITFGSLNFFPKITDQVLETWAKILLEVPDSKLCIKSKYFNEQANKDSFIAKLAALGIDKQRLIFKTKTIDLREHLDCYNEIDIHLDSFPYNGTTTTCEALWQGVPTVTLEGNSHRCRVGSSLLHQVGIQDYVATSIDDYINIAVTKASNLPRLAELRNSLREKMSASPLMDAEGFVAELETIYSEIAPQA